MSAGLPRCILFDLDGTLLDSLPGIEYSVLAALKYCNLPPPQTSIREMIGPPIRTILSRAAGISEVRALDALEKAFRASYDSDGWLKTPCFSGADQVLRIMSERNYRLFVVSNKPKHIAMTILRQNDIVGRFEMIVTRDSRSPEYSDKPEMIRHVIQENRCAAEDCLLVGDTMEDAEAAHAVEIAFAYMTCGYGKIPTDTTVPMNYRLDSLLQFLTLMAKEPRP